MDNIVSYYGKIHHDLRKLEQKDRERIKLIQSVTNLIHLQDEHFDLNEMKYIFDLPLLETKFPIISDELSNQSNYFESLDISDNIIESTDSIDHDINQLIADIGNDFSSCEAMSSFLEQEVLLSYASNNMNSQEISQLNLSISTELNNQFQQIERDIVLDHTHNETKSGDVVTNNSTTSNNNELECLELLLRNKYPTLNTSSATTSASSSSSSYSSSNSKSTKALFHEIQTQIDLDYTICHNNSSRNTVNNNNNNNDNNYATRLKLLRKEHEIILHKAIATCQPICPFYIQLKNTANKQGIP